MLNLLVQQLFVNIGHLTNHFSEIIFYGRPFFPEIQTFFAEKWFLLIIYNDVLFPFLQIYKKGCVCVCPILIIIYLYYIWIIVGI
jgi:hypothetical protein